MVLQSSRGPRSRRAVGVGQLTASRRAAAGEKLAKVKAYQPGSGPHIEMNSVLIKNGSHGLG